MKKKIEFLKLFNVQQNIKTFYMFKLRKQKDDTNEKDYQDLRYVIKNSLHMLR